MRQGSKNEYKAQETEATEIKQELTETCEPEDGTKETNCEYNAVNTNRKLKTSKTMTETWNL